jgi:hypothetical protein
MRSFNRHVSQSTKISRGLFSEERSILPHPAFHFAVNVGSIMQSKAVILESERTAPSLGANSSQRHKIRPPVSRM